MIEILLTIMVLVVLLGLIHYAASLFFTHPALTLIDLVLAIAIIIYLLKKYNLLGAL